MSSPPKETVAPTEDEVKAKAAADKARQAADELTKYKAAAEIVNAAMKKLVEAAVEGAKILDLCNEGDKWIEEGASAVYNSKTAKGKVTKGLAFPTSISVNNCVSHYSPVPSDPLATTALAKGDVVKIHVGAHIDGFASVSAETLIVGATESEPATGRAADVVKAAWHAAEVAMRLVKPGEKNWAVTEAMNKVAAAWGCKPVEGMLSCAQTQNVIDGKKRIILNPTPELRSGLDNVTFAEGDVWGIDILVASTEDGKSKAMESRTSIYQRATDVTYQLKLKTSRETFSDIQKKAGPFPFTIRALENEKKARVGVQEAVQHGLLRPYDVVYTPEGTYVAAFHFTLALLPGGPSLISAPPIWYKAEKLKTEKELEDEELKGLVGKKLREDKKKKKKNAAAAGGEDGSAEKAD